MPTDTKLNQLIINQLTQEQYDEAKAAGTLSDTELYITDSDDEALTNNNISNCITYIPQDIKLELNNGTLTLKAGSKVYVPNGAGVFDAITFPNNKTFTATGSSNSKVFAVYFPDDGTIKIFLPQNIESGTSYSVTDGIWYDTTNNSIKRITDGSVAYSGLSFPICVLQLTNGIITSIDQVFNGFGYIGSTIFALPGVKGLIPNGRNADGSLKNIESEIKSVQIIELSINERYYIILGNNDGLILPNTASFNFVVRENNSSDPYGFTYDSTTNKYTGIGSTNLNQQLYFAIVGSCKRENDKITSFTPKTAFHAVDRNDSSWLSGLGMPSSRYIDLTLGASGSTYTAPANGYLYFVCQGPTTYFYVVNKTLENKGGELGMCVTLAGSFYRAFLPVSKGHQIAVYYDGSITMSKGCFIFAEGE